MTQPLPDALGAHPSVPRDASHGSPNSHRGSRAGNGPTTAWIALALLCAAQFMLVLDVTVTNVALPVIGRELGIHGPALGWVVAAYSLAFGALLIVGGLFADRAGLRLALTAGLVVFGVGSLAAAASASAPVLIGARVVQGIGAAALSPAALGLVAVLFTGRAQHRALAISGGIGAAGAAVGAVLGGVLTDTVGWRWVFLINVPVAIVVLVGVPLMRGARRGGAGSVVPSSVRRPAVAVLGSSRVQGGSLVMFASSALLIGSFLLLTLRLQDAAGWSPLATGLAFVPVAVATIAGAQAAGHLVSRMRVATIGSLAFTLAFAGFALAASVPTPVWLIVGASLAALGVGGGFVLATTTALSSAINGTTGLTSGVVNTAHEVGGAAGSVSAAVLVAVSATVGTSIGFGVAAALAAIIAVAAGFALPKTALTASAGIRGHH